MNFPYKFRTIFKKRKKNVNPYSLGLDKKKKFSKLKKCTTKKIRNNKQYDGDDTRNTQMHVTISHDHKIPDTVYPCFRDTVKKKNR